MSEDFLLRFFASASEYGIERVYETVRIGAREGLGRNENRQLNTVFLVFFWA